MSTALAWRDLAPPCAFDAVLFPPLMADHPVVTFDAGVLSRLPQVDMLNGNSLFSGPFSDFTDVFRPVVVPCGAGLAAPFDDAAQAPDGPSGGQGKNTPRYLDLRG